MHSAASEQDASSWLVSDGLKELELLLRAVLSHQSEPILIVDDDRVCLDASSGASKILGLSTGKIIGQRLDDFVKPDKLHHTEKNDVLEGRHIAILRDIADGAADAGDSTDFALSSLDSSGLIVAWHAGAERIYGYSSEEIIGQHVSALYLDDDELRIKLHEELRTIELQGHFGNESWHKKKDGSRFWANVLTTALPAASRSQAAYGRSRRARPDRPAAAAAVLAKMAAGAEIIVQPAVFHGVPGLK
jgi:PAS domain S-box-containing protein